ncbi:MAG: iron ABC transporter permease [Candidatus Omnitrophica bacterium]|nr:iron ABC transporter permease [Candidatus Omnitrophota bacterium]
MDKYKKRKQVIGILLILLILAVFVFSLIGAVYIAPHELFSSENRDIYELRLMRILLGLIAGAGLSVAGVIFQGILRNPLAEPYVLGISSGASLGAVLAIVLGLGKLWGGIHFLPVAAFSGAVLTLILVYNLARMGGRVPVQSLILSGVVVGAMFSAVVMFLVSISPNEKLHDIIWWMLGNLQIFDRKYLIIVLIATGAGIIAAMFFARDLNAIAIGEEEALHLGIKVDTVKKILFCLASLITGVIVSACGLIGFVGLIIPHTMRLIIGPDHRGLLPASCLGGAIFLITCDTLARTVILPAELPIGVITALIGGPFFLTLLRKKRQIHFR